MNLSGAPKAYDRADQTRVRADIKKADDQNHKRGQDLELGGARLIFTDRATGERSAYELVSGVLTLTPL